jgi:hypothetical protein
MTRKSYDRLADHLACGRIDMAQFMAGRKFQRHFGLADKRRPADLERERPGNLTEDQLLAWKALAKCYRALGQNGSAIIWDTLLSGMTAKQIAESRGMAGEERYLAKRVWECLNTLAVVYGFSNRAVTAHEFLIAARPSPSASR